MKRPGAFNVVFDEESNSGLENAVALRVQKMQVKDMKLNFFTITVGKSLEEQII